MRIQSISACAPSGFYSNLSIDNKKRQVYSSNPSFKMLLPEPTVKALKMCVYDLDDTLLEGVQATRNKVLNFSKEVIANGEKRILVYSSSRPLKTVKPLIENGTLILPDYCVCNNGVNIYKNTNGQLEEISEWSKELAKGFDKEKIRNFMVEIANKNKFSPEEWEKIPVDIIPEGQKEFRGSKITEYEVFGSPLNIYFMMSPGIYEKTLPDIKQFLNAKGINAEVKFQNFNSENLMSLDKWFPKQVALDMRNHATPRLNKDGSVDVAIITAASDKGKASEYIRNFLGIKNHEVFAAGDDVNDLGNADKNYFFALLSNSKKDFENLIEKLKLPNIIKTSKPGVEGIWETIG